MRIAIITFDGADELDFIAPYEILQHAAGLDDRHDVALVTLQPTARITGAHGLRVQPDGVLDTGADLLIIPGGGWVSRAATGIQAQITEGTLLDCLHDHFAAGVQLAAICTGAMALAYAGLLDNRTATTHRGALGDLRAFKSIRVVEARVVDDGDILTSGGVSAGIDLSLWLVERYWHRELADQVARYLEYPRQGEVLRTGD